MARKTQMKFEVGIGLAGSYSNDAATRARGQGAGMLVPGSKNAFDPDALIDFAKHVDACGFDYYSTPEHVAISTWDATEGRAAVGMAPMKTDNPIRTRWRCWGSSRATRSRSS
jgi:hypothetical protein